MSWPQDRADAIRDRRTTIRLNPGQYSVSLRFRFESALAGCTDVAADDNACLVVTRNWPRLSAGEELLWSVLAWLNGSGDLPSMVDLESGLDPENYALVLSSMTAPTYRVVTA